jgi:hypothetical protein
MHTAGIAKINTHAKTRPPHSPLVPREAEPEPEGKEARGGKGGKGGDRKGGKGKDAAASDAPNPDEAPEPPRPFVTGPTLAGEDGVLRAVPPLAAFAERTVDWPDAADEAQADAADAAEQLEKLEKLGKLGQQDEEDKEEQKRGQGQGAKDRSVSRQAGFFDFFFLSDLAFLTDIFLFFLFQFTFTAACKTPARHRPKRRPARPPCPPSIRT